MRAQRVSNDLLGVLEACSQRMFQPKSTVLFRRGEKASGMFAVLGGRVSLDFGVDSRSAQFYGPGALVGLPATLTRSNYSMTATVAEDATLGYLPREVLEPLLRNNPSLTQELLVILGEKTLEMKRMKQGLLESDRLPVQVVKMA